MSPTRYTSNALADDAGQRCRRRFEVEFELGAHGPNVSAWQAAVMTISAAPMPSIVSRSEWDKARAELLVREKELTRMKDGISAARRRLPMVEIVEPYTFDTVNGPASLLDLFDGRRQLIVQHFMYGNDWEEGCSGCSMMAHHIGPLSHLHAKDTSLVLISHAPTFQTAAVPRPDGVDAALGVVRIVNLQRGLPRDR